MREIDDVLDILSIDLIGVVPEDEHSDASPPIWGHQRSSINAWLVRRAYCEYRQAGASGYFAPFYSVFQALGGFFGVV